MNSKHQPIKVPLFSHQIKSNQKLQQALKSWSSFSVAESEKYIEKLSKIQEATFTNSCYNLDIPRINFDEFEQIQDKETIGLGSDKFFFYFINQCYI